jgi:hypothetical protein
MKNYAQLWIDQLFEEGDLDYNFLGDFFAIVETYAIKNFGTQFKERHKSREQQLKDVLKLVEFFIDDGAYEGFYMPDYFNISQSFKTYELFLKFLNEKQALTPNYFDLILSDGERYTVGLNKVKTGAKAPKVTPEIEQIFWVDGVMPTID